MRKIYAGVGWRDTPERILTRMENAGRALAKSGFTLSSGKARGPDQAFERGCDSVDGRKRIYLEKDATPESIEHAQRFHPAWGALSDFGKRLMGRNSMIILGPDLKRPVEFIVCYTDGGKVAGGTGQSLRLAKHYQIRVFNLWDLHEYVELKRYVREHDYLERARHRSKEQVGA